MIDVKLECLRITTSKGSGDLVEEAGRYYDFVTLSSAAPALPQDTQRTDPVCISDQVSPAENLSLDA